MRGKILAWLTVFMISAGAAQAALIEAGWQDGGDRLITVDTTSGLAWLDLSVTQGKSANEVLALLASDSRFTLFRYATGEEFRGLAENAGIPVRDGSVVPENFAPVVALLDLVGRTVDVPTAFFAAQGLLDDPNPASPDLWTVSSFDAFPEGTAFVLEGNAFFPADSANPSVGSWLVGPKSAALVPSPGTLLLLVLGIVAAGAPRFIARKDSVIPSSI